MRVDVPVDVRYGFGSGAGSDEGDPWSAPASVSLLKTRIPINPGRPYHVLSWTSIADAASLREAGSAYPDWISGRYLQLPSTLPERVRRLAEEIAASQENSYDKAAAIQEYLRRTIEYREDIEAPPEGRDPIDYLLFDSRQGYCNYYASTMVVMARAVGIPARLAVGYVGGELEGETGRYVVREHNTHAWVEVYFPSFGWVEFEPTASEPPIPRVENSDDQLVGRPGGDAESRLDRDLERLREEEEGSLGVIVPTARSGRPSLPLAALILLVFGGGAGAIALWYLKWMRGEDTSPAGRIYAQMCSYTRLSGVRGEAHHTPYEYASLVAQHIPHSAPHVEQITELFVRDQFGPAGGGRAEEQAAEQAWRALRPLVMQRLVHRMPELARSALRWPW
jgi:transglutaminase-like putative cysteine protease